MELANCHVNLNKIKNISTNKIHEITKIRFTNEEFLYLCNCICEYINDCSYDSIDFTKRNWKEYLEGYFKEDAFDFFEDELTEIPSIDNERSAWTFIKNFHKAVKTLVDQKIIIFYK